MAGPEVQDNDYDGMEPVTVQFAVVFNLVQTIIWWSLFGVAVAVGFYKRNTVSRAWFVYTLLIIVLFLTGCQTSFYLGYAQSVETHHVRNWLYGVFVAFFNLARSAFLLVLLVVASGYCITRSDFGPYTGSVIGVPLTVLVTGLVTDFTFFALQVRAEKDKSTTSQSGAVDLSQLSPLMASLWFICSVLNLASLILAWMYTFEMLGKEITALEEEQQAFQRRQQQNSRAARAEEDDDPDSPNSLLAAHTFLNDRRGLGASGSGAAGSSGGGVLNEDGMVVAKDADETVADRVAYNTKRTLLSRFAKGVCVYLVGNILVLVMPIFVNHVVQSTLQVAQLAVYLFFMSVLLIIFRPREASPYLMVGFNEEDADERGVSGLATGIAMSDLPPGAAASVAAAAAVNAYGKLPSLAATSTDIHRYNHQQQQQPRGLHSVVDIEPISVATLAKPPPPPSRVGNGNGLSGAAHRAYGGSSGEQATASGALPVSLFGQGGNNGGIGNNGGNGNGAMEAAGRTYASSSQARLAAALQRPTQENNPFTLDEDEDDDHPSGGYTTSGKYTAVPGREK